MMEMLAMKNLMISSLQKMGVMLTITFGCMNFAWSQTPASSPSFPQANWVSKNSSDQFSIQNGAGTPIVIEINVGGSGPNASGVNIKNCGETTHINAGSSTICSTNDSKNPVTLSSDGNNAAYGTYQIKPQQ
jgi:hypothetical protein